MNVNINLFIFVFFFLCFASTIFELTFPVLSPWPVKRYGDPRQDISVMLMRPTLKLIADERTVQSGITAWTDATRARPRCRHEITRGLRSVERGRKLTRNRFKAFIYTSSNRRCVGQRPAAAAIRQRVRERRNDRRCYTHHPGRRSSSGG